jgi:hypothetical protein
VLVLWRLAAFQSPLTEEKMIAWIDEIADLDPFAGTSRMVDMVVDGCTNLLEDQAIVDQIKDADVIVVDAAVACGSVVRASGIWLPSA